MRSSLSITTCANGKGTPCPVIFHIVHPYIAIHDYCTCILMFIPNNTTCGSSAVLRLLCLLCCRADDVASDFTLRGVEVQSIHGDRLVYPIDTFYKYT